MNGYFRIFVLFEAFSVVLFALSGCGEGAKSPEGQEQSLRESGVPTWANCTISLRNIPRVGAEDLAGAKGMLGEIAQQSDWSDLHIIQTETTTKICRGYFRSFSTSKAQRTFQEVRNYSDASGRRPFAQAAFSALPVSQQKQIVFGPAEWEIRQASGETTLCIGFYVNDGKVKDRLARAVKEVRELRGRGVEAWYYHGQYRSGVYVSHFGAYYEWVTVGEKTSGELIRARKLTTRDPAFRALLEKYPELRKYKVNGKAEIKKAGILEVYDKSRLVLISRLNEEVLDTAMGL